MRRLLFVLACLVIAPLTSSAQEAAVLSDDPRAEGLQTTAVAPGQLNFPMGLVALPSGSLLVPTGPSASGNFYASTGTLVRLSASDGDGSLDVRRVLAEGLPGSLVAAARMGNLI